MQLSNYVQLVPVQSAPEEGDQLSDFLIKMLASKFGQGLDDVEAHIPAGYTYFGQFVDHDLSFMVQTDHDPGQHEIPLQYLRNRRCPGLELDSLYGAGLKDSAVPYIKDTGEFELGRLSTGEPRDLPRGGEFSALIADPRNDENLLVAQMQVLFMNFHNKVVRHLRQDVPGITEAFELARKEVVHTYRHLVLHDFAPRLLNYNVYEAIVLKNKGRLARPAGQQYELSIEFAVAAFRLHSMVRRTYTLQNECRDFPGDGPVVRRLEDLLTYQQDPFHQRTNQLHACLAVDWRLFFDNTGKLVQRANSISPHIAFDIPGVIEHAGRQGAFNMFERNLLRGRELQLGTASQAIGAIRGQHPSLAQELGLGTFSSRYLKREFPEETGWTQNLPLWLYCMLEGWEDYNGNRLGILGSWIVADTLRTASEASAFQDKTWTVPGSLVHKALRRTQPRRHDQELTLRDLVDYTYHTAE